MRVKKLNVNRRHKSGEDETAIGDSEQSKWVSPTKLPATTGSASGASSPSDPTSVHPLHAAGLQQQHQQHQQANLGENSPLRFQTNNSELFARGAVGAGGVVPLPAMPKPAAMPLMMASRPGDAVKPASAGWHEAVGRSAREAVHAQIVEVLRSLKPHAPEKVLERLPGLAYRMEESLFKLAASEAEYSDASTLAQRIAGIQETNAKRLLTQQQQQQQSAKTLEQSTSQRNGSSSSPSGGNSDGAEAVAAMQARQPLGEEQARAVFQCLQTWRQKLVNMYGVAPWEILPNQTLAKVSVFLPTTEQELAVCGVQEELLARFGSSLVQELQRVGSRMGAGPAASKAGRSTKAGRKAEGGKRAADGLSGGSNKKRRAGGASSNAAGARLAPATPSLSGSSLLSPSQLLFRPHVGVDSLPTLLPSASVASVAATASSSSATGAGNKSPFASSSSARVSPGAQVLQQSYVLRQPPSQQQGADKSPSPAQENHMHLLAQSAGQMSKQQEAKSLELYEQEVQSLRWMLHQSQQEKTQLESELQRLRAQLQGE